MGYAVFVCQTNKDAGKTKHQVLLKWKLRIINHLFESDQTIV